MVQRLTYRKRHSYATKSNQHRVVKTPGEFPYFFEGISIVFLSVWNWWIVFFDFEFLWWICLFVVDRLVLDCDWFECVMCVKIRGEAGVPDHEEESEWTEMPRNWEENPRGMFRFSGIYAFLIQCSFVMRCLFDLQWIYSSIKLWLQESLLLSVVSITGVFLLDLNSVRM